MECKMGGSVSRLPFYSESQIKELLDAPSSRARARAHRKMFGEEIPDDRVGEAVQGGSVSKKLLVRAAVWDMRRSSVSLRDAGWISPYIVSHALPWKSDDEYGDASGFAFDLISANGQ